MPDKLLGHYYHILTDDEYIDDMVGGDFGVPFKIAVISTPVEYSRFMEQLMKQNQLTEIVDTRQSAPLFPLGSV